MMRKHVNAGGEKVSRISRKKRIVLALAANLVSSNEMGNGTVQHAWDFAAENDRARVTASVGMLSVVCRASHRA